MLSIQEEPLDLSHKILTLVLERHIMWFNVVGGQMLSGKRFCNYVLSTAACATSGITVRQDPDLESFFQDGFNVMLITETRIFRSYVYHIF